MSDLDRVLQEAGQLPSSLTAACQTLESADRDRAEAKERAEEAQAAADKAQGAADDAQGAADDAEGESSTQSSSGGSSGSSGSSGGSDQSDAADAADEANDAADAAKSAASAANSALEQAEAAFERALEAFEHLWAESDATVTTLQQCANDIAHDIGNTSARVGEARVAEVRASIMDGARAMEANHQRMTQLAEKVTSTRNDCAVRLESLGGEVASRLGLERRRQESGKGFAGMKVMQGDSAQVVGSDAAESQVRSADSEWHSAHGHGSANGPPEGIYVGNARTPAGARVYARNNRRGIEVVTDKDDGRARLEARSPGDSPPRAAKSWETNNAPAINSPTHDLAPKGGPHAVWNSRLGMGGLGSW